MRVEEIRLLLLLSGIPGAGKSTFARNLKEFIKLKSRQSDNIKISSVAIVSFDEFDKNEDISYHMMRGAALGYLKSIIGSNAQSSIENKSSIGEYISINVFIVDDLFHLKSMRKEVQSIVTDMNSEINNYYCILKQIFIKTDVELAIQRNTTRMIGSNNISLCSGATYAEYRPRIVSTEVCVYNE